MMEDNRSRVHVKMTMTNALLSSEISSETMNGREISRIERNGILTQQIKGFRTFALIKEINTDSKCKSIF